MKGVIETTPGAAHSPKLLFVGRPDLHTRILAQYLSGALCATYHFDFEAGDTTTAAQDSLVLFDCKDQAHEVLEGRLERLYESQPSSRAVLIGAVPNGRVEALIHWPCLKGIFFEDCSQELLLKGMHTVLRGGIWLPRFLLEQCFEQLRQVMPSRRRTPVNLSRRELDILCCIAKADSNADIAARLHISEHTVKSHIYNIFRKIGVRNRTEASHWAMRNLLHT